MWNIFPVLHCLPVIRQIVRENPRWDCLLLASLWSFQSCWALFLIPRLPRGPSCLCQGDSNRLMSSSSSSILSTPGVVFSSPSLLKGSPLLFFLMGCGHAVDHGSFSLRMSQSLFPGLGLPSISHPLCHLFLFFMTIAFHFHSSTSFHSLYTFSSRYIIQNTSCEARFGRIACRLNSGVPPTPIDLTYIEQFIINCFII